MPRLRTGILLALLTRAALAEPTASEQHEVAPASQLIAEGLLAGTVRRDGVLLDAWLRYRHPLYRSSDEAFRDNEAGIGLIDQVSPVFNQVGAYLELAPASFFRITGGYELVDYFGVLNSLRPLTRCDRLSSATASDARCDFAPAREGQVVEERRDHGHRVWAEALLQGKLGPLVAADTFTLERWWFRRDWSAGHGYAFWLNELFALPQRKDDVVLTNSGALLLEVVPDRGGSHPNVLAGLEEDLAYARGTDYLTERVGLLGVLRVPAWRGYRELAAALLVQLYTHDRYLTRGPPFVGLVLSAQTESFLSRKDAP